ncbi:MAG: phospholipase D family protein [Candidatus Diapherotrites archaeon]|nr:phospholipase D family protein [Candidatus Diapherotrites archaeon]
MGKISIVLFIIVIALAAFIYFQDNDPKELIGTGLTTIMPEQTSSTKAFFCPEENCADQLIKEINSAEQSIHIAIYSLTHDEIADALISAGERGVEVMVLMEPQQAGSEYSDDEMLLENNVKVRLMKNSDGIMHHKFAVFDGKTVSTGSFNYSENADERNNENIVFISDSGIVREFEEEFQKLWDLSEN